VLSRQEVEGEDAAAQSDLFARLDRNNDNRLTPQEWQWSRSSFEARDRDRDGVLTRRELAGDGFSEDPATATVTVGAETRWVDTGVSVLAGDQVRFQVSGTVQMSPDRGDVADPRGSRSNRRAPDAPLPQVPAGALIGRINQGAPFVIGDRASVTMPQTGRLQLSINDDHLADNSGGFRVAVTVER
jgi:hypothetical protein